MFDIGSSELLLIVVVAIVAIGPKDMPLALRTAGRWIGKFRRMSNHFRSGIETMIREAELEEMEQKWREQNEAIMQAHAGQSLNPTIEHAPVPALTASPTVADHVAEVGAEEPWPEAQRTRAGEPQTPLPPG